MKEAFTITTILIFLALILGVMYNTMTPYLVHLGVISEKSRIVPVAKDGGVFRSQNFARTFDQIGAGGILKEDVLDIQFDPQATSSVIIGTQKEIYISDDGGGQWRALSKGFLETEGVITSFAVDPKSPERVYVGTHSQGVGKILKSKGAEFYEVYSTIGVDDQILGIWVDSYDPSAVFAGTSKGLFLESRDFGESWKIKRDFGEAVRKLIMLPSDTRKMFAIVGDGKLMKTENQGGVWQDLTGALRPYQEGLKLDIEDVVIDRKDESHMFLATSKGLLESRNRGVSFSQVPLVSEKGGSMVSTLAIDPKNSQILYLAIDSQVHKSIDGGKSWQVKTLPTKRIIRVIRVMPSDPKTIFIGVRAKIVPTSSR